jgi:CHAT domain-containing protein
MPPSFGRLAVVLSVVALTSAGCAQSVYSDFVGLKNQGRVEEALQTLRREFAHPTRGGPEPVYLRQHFLITLGELAQTRGATPEADAEARRVYQDGLDRFARDDGNLRALMDNGMALYFSRSYRNGVALPYFRREMNHWERVKNPMRLSLATDALAAAYWDMGEVELSRMFHRRAQEHAAEYFVVGERPSDDNEWLQYANILGNHAEKAAQLGDAVEVARLWSLQEKIGRRYLKLFSLQTFEAAQRFAVAGNFDVATTLLTRATTEWAAERGSWNARIQMLGDGARQCSEAIVSFFAKRYNEAAPALDRCAEMTAAAQLRENDASFEQKRGLAYEMLHDETRAVAGYRAAIAAAETTRASYSVSERAKFFRTFFRHSYWGLVRIQAKRAAKTPAAFFEAMYTSELVRGRQLGEMIDADMQARISPDSLRTLQQRLPADTAVLAYTVTDTEIVFMGFTHDRTLAATVPYDARRFATQVRAITADLATPESATSSLQHRLMEISRLIVGPARPLLAGKTRVIALPDGIMNTVPFDLLSAAEREYRPLIADYTVVASPSLVFIEHAERRRRDAGAANLLVVADPRYSKTRPIAGVSAEDLMVATRGSRHLAYFEPLPETRTEAAAIAAMFRGQTVDLLIGEQALESRLRGRDLKSFGFLHFATHGILGGEVPGVNEPALVLGDEPDEDGFLTASEVAGLKLDAELAVLSACNTGSGEFVTGEGVMGMSRAFLGAGTRAVVVSLWPVASLQTERLMVAFYRHLRNGRAAGDALRAAKLEMVDGARGPRAVEAHPFFWAPFILLGG